LTEDDTTFFAERPARIFRLTKALNAGPGGRADGTIYLRLMRFAWCLGHTGNRHCASLVKAVAADSVGALNSLNETKMDAIWRSWLAEGVEPWISPPLPAGLPVRRGKGWFEQE
jgi:hypothetical protein